MLGLVLLVIGIGNAVGAPDIDTVDYNPHFKPNRSVIVQLFEWKFNDIAKECEEFLGPRGYGGVQVSPVNENAIRKDFARPWWERYHPVSYEIASRSGSKEEFQAMTRSCNDAGVRVYVDLVLNHMAAPQPNGGDEEAQEDKTDDGLLHGTGDSTANASSRYYPAVPYDEDNFHPPCDIVDYTDGHQIRNCEFGQRPDLDHSNYHVKERIVDFLNRLVELGAAGFRISGANYIWPMDLRDIFARVNELNPEYDFPDATRPFFFQEVTDLGDQAISKTEYAGYGVVTEILHAVQIAAVFNGLRPLSSLINWGPSMGFILPPYALVFVDTHYTQRGDGIGRASAESMLTHKEPKKYTMAVAYMLAHPYGIKRIMSSFRFENNYEGPPTDENDAITSPEFNDDDGQCLEESRWVCEHRWNAIVNMVAFANYVIGEGINSFQNVGPNHVAFCRGSKGFVAINNDPDADLDGSMYACVAPGDYCDVISGSLVDGECTAIKITVDEDRRVKLSFPVNGDSGILAISDESRVPQ